MDITDRMKRNGEPVFDFQHTFPPVDIDVLDSLRKEKGFRYCDDYVGTDGKGCSVITDGLRVLGIRFGDAENGDKTKVYITSAEYTAPSGGRVPIVSLQDADHVEDISGKWPGQEKKDASGSVMNRRAVRTVAHSHGPESHYDFGQAACLDAEMLDILFEEGYRHSGNFGGPEKNDGFSTITNGKKTYGIRFGEAGTEYEDNVLLVEKNDTVIDIPDYDFSAPRAGSFWSHAATLLMRRLSGASPKKPVQSPEIPDDKKIFWWRTYTREELDELGYVNRGPADTYRFMLPGSNGKCYPMVAIGPNRYISERLHDAYKKMLPQLPPLHFS